MPSKEKITERRASGRKDRSKSRDDDDDDELDEEEDEPENNTFDKDNNETPLDAVEVSCFHWNQ